VPASRGPDGSGVAARRTALEVLARVEDDGAYANLALRSVLDRSDLEQMDRNLVTDLVAGTIRRRRSVDALVDRFLDAPPPPAARRALRLGAYQLVYRDDLPDYAVVSTTVEAAPSRFRRLVNAVLRRVAAAPVEFASLAEELSYPDWIVERLESDLGPGTAREALAAMDEAPSVHRRDDGYTQDLASQWVAAAVGAAPGDLVLDLCAAPGGKATALAAAGATVVAAEVHLARVGLVATAARTVGCDRMPVDVVVADGRTAPLTGFDRVLVDAPCTGLGVIRRRPEARWRRTPADVGALARLQRELLGAGLRAARPGGLVLYSTCSPHLAETSLVVADVLRDHPGVERVPLALAPGDAAAEDARLWPHLHGTDGMYAAALRVPDAPR